MEGEEKGQIVASSERSNVGVLVVQEHLAAALEDDPRSLDAA
jgi:hypothetical protein